MRKRLAEILRAIAARLDPPVEMAEASTTGLIVNLYSTEPPDLGDAVSWALRTPR